MKLQRGGNCSSYRHTFLPCIYSSQLVRYIANPWIRLAPWGRPRGCLGSRWLLKDATARYTEKDGPLRCSSLTLVVKEEHLIIGEGCKSLMIVSKGGLLY
jgi:hypothetical protein